MFFPGREAAVYQQVCGFLEGGILGQLFYRDTPISENAFFTIHEGNGTSATSRIADSDIKRYETDFLTQFGDVDGFLPLFL